MSRFAARIAAISGVLVCTSVLSPCALAQTTVSRVDADLPPEYFSPTRLPPAYMPPKKKPKVAEYEASGGPGRAPNEALNPVTSTIPRLLPQSAFGAAAQRASTWPPAFAPPQPPSSAQQHVDPTATDVPQNVALAAYSFDEPSVLSAPLDAIQGRPLTGPFLTSPQSAIHAPPRIATLPTQAPVSPLLEPAFNTPEVPFAQPGIYYENGTCPPFSPFSPDPDYSHVPFDPAWEWDVYDGKWSNCTQRPWIELGRGLYRPGPIPPSPNLLGHTNLISQTFLLYGDYRTALANIDVNGDERTVWAHRLNLEFDYKFTATERIHAFWGPVDEDNRFTRVEANDGSISFIDEFDDDFDTLFFEGDLGYIWGGVSDQYAPFDLPFAVGKFPLFFQNGVWINDAVEGFAFTIPARHSHVPLIPNYDVTFFFGFDDIDSAAFAGNDNAASLYGVHGFFDMLDGHLELGYALLEDTTGQGRTYHNVGMSFTRRYFQRVSNALRVIVNTGQAPYGAPDTADGTLLMFQNALISSNPNFFVPYFNMYAGFGRPQSAARLLDNVLSNTGINFETDGLTGYPTLDPTGRNSWGGAIGLNWLGPDFSWQWIVELATVQTFGNSASRLAKDDQYAIGTRYQIPLNNAWLLRLDTIHGFFENDDDIRAARAELRWKF